MTAWEKLELENETLGNTGIKVIAAKRRPGGYPMMTITFETPDGTRLTLQYDAGKKWFITPVPNRVTERSIRTHRNIVADILDRHKGDWKPDP